MVWLFTAVCLLVVQLTIATPTGAPPAACADMMPQHGADPQGSPSPYTLTVTAGEPGQYFVSLNAPTTGDYQFFRGFFIRAMDANGDILGEFSNMDASVKARPCGGGGSGDNGITHVDNSEKTLITADWNFDSDTTGIEMSASVVYVHGVHWVGMTTAL